jgi:hypothetical protein
MVGRARKRVELDGEQPALVRASISSAAANRSATTRAVEFSTNRCVSFVESRTDLRTQVTADDRDETNVGDGAQTRDQRRRVQVQQLARVWFVGNDIDN